MTKSQLMKTFIRLDQVGHWRGTEHVSSFLGAGDDIESLNSDAELLGVPGGVYFEDGISCYELDEDGVADLYNYWIVLAGISEDMIKNMQVTVFRGELNGYGTDGECVATCAETVKEFPATIIFEKWQEMQQRWFDDDETTAENTKEYIFEHAQEMIDFINAQ